MNTYADKNHEAKRQASAVRNSDLQYSKTNGFQTIDNRPAAIAQRKLQELTNTSLQTKNITRLQEIANSGSAIQPLRKEANTTGLPDNLKTGIETLSGFPMDDVNVHYDSPKPIQLLAHAFAQGTEIFLAHGQQKHLPHEAWHLVQQKQGRVKPTRQWKGSTINDDAGLEREATVMGARALQGKALSRNHLTNGIEQSASTEKKIGKPASHVTAQLIPDKRELYWRRLRQKAGPAAGIPLAQHLFNYITLPANAAGIGANVVNAVNLAFAGGAVLVTIPNLRAAVNNGLNATLTGPGQYLADTAHNAALTGILRNNPFMQTVMDGTLQGGVSGWRNAAPIGGVIPVPGPGIDDRVLETIDLFNRLTNIPGGLPAVQVNPIRGPHAAMNGQGQMSLGWAAARGNILHEFGHHLENNLDPADFATVHNFLTARINVPPGVLGAAPMAGMRDAGYFFEHHPGYEIDMPEINAGGLAGRRIPQTRWQHFLRAIGTPYTAIKQVIGRAYHATPLRYIGLIGSGLFQQLGKLASVITRRREPRNWAAKGVENFFVHNANNQQLSYSTAVHDFNNPAWYQGTTEYLSTTTEFFNRPSHARELVLQDPLRVALFLYLANRPQYNLVRAAFNPVAGVDLDDLIHVVR